jgi:hypothetical protein
MALPSEERDVEVLNRMIEITTTQGTKDDQGKLRWDLMPWDALEEVVKVITFGCKKYDDRNWEKGLDYGRLIGSTMRHLSKWFRGVEIDDDSGINHLAHVACNVIFLLTYCLRGSGNDDRIKL